MKKILLLNVGYSNKGNVALVNSTIKNMFNNYIPNVKFKLMGNLENKANIKEQIGLNNGISIRKPYKTLISLKYLVICIYTNLFRRFGFRSALSVNSRLFEYDNCDLVINSGGDHLSGESKYGSLSTFLDISYALILNKPVILYGESLGYYGSYIMDSIAKLILNKTKLIIVREKFSI